MRSFSLTNFEIQKHFQNELQRNDLPKIGWTYVINLHEYNSIGTHWIDLYANCNNVIYFNSYGVEHIPKEKSH